MSGLVTGTQGGMPDGAHITSGMIGEFQAGIVGSESYIFNVKDNLAAELSNTNTVHMASGDWLFQGRHCYVDDAGIDFALTSGTQGMLRNDLLVATYTKQPADPGVEAVTYSVITGTPDTTTPTDPSYTEGNILLGDTTVQVPLYRVTWNGVTPGEPEALLSVVDSISKLGSKLSSVIIYDNPAGSGGPYALSQDLSHFSRIEILGNINGEVDFSTILNEPNGKTMSITASYIPTGALIRTCVTTLALSETTATVASAAWRDDINGYNAGNLINIFKVIGFLK